MRDWAVKPIFDSLLFMTSSTAVSGPRPLTAKGQATRARILEHAAELIYAEGVHATNNDKLRKAAGVSGSQINHYFPTKESLVLAVIAWQAERVLAFHHDERFGRFDSIEALRAWARHYVAYERACREGCTLGSLAGEVVKTDLDVHAELTGAFDRWRAVFRDGLRLMQDEGRLSAAADPVRLADLLLAAFQGGMLLAQVARDVAPLRDALEAAVDHVQTYTLPPPTVRGRRA